MKAEIWKGEVIFVRNNFRRAVFVAFVAVVDVVVVVVVVDNVRGALNSRTRSTALALFSRAASPPLPLCPSALLPLFEKCYTKVRSHYRSFRIRIRLTRLITAQGQSQGVGEGDNQLLACAVCVSVME